MSDGIIYVAKVAAPTGIPVNSPDWTALTTNRDLRDIGSVIGAYNPVDAATYIPGQLITYNGQLYQVMNSPAIGVPGSSTSYRNLSGTSPTGPTGATGTSGTVTYNSAQASGYPQNQLVYYNGNLYAADVTGPTGTPGTAGSGFTQLTNSSRIGRGITDVAPAYNPVDAASYQPGQLVTYNGQLYQVTNSPATGTPGSSPNYQNLSGTGPTGPTDPYI
jgi:hypothetical protein